VQAHLFGEPELKPALSQWHTPPWLARRLAAWVPRGARVIEPSCGGGALLEALLNAGHQPVNLMGLDVDPAWVHHCRERLPSVRVEVADFLDLAAYMLVKDACDVVAMNPPFEDNLHMRFVLRALFVAPVVVGIFPVGFEFSAVRDRELWSTRGVVTRRAKMPDRVQYGGLTTPSFDSVALQIERRTSPRARGEVCDVREEVWTP
jgi:predicted RNA methylase